jgi:hypothetical protein
MVIRRIPPGPQDPEVSRRGCPARDQARLYQRGEQGERTNRVSLDRAGCNGDNTSRLQYRSGQRGRPKPITQQTKQLKLAQVDLTIVTEVKI